MWAFITLCLNRGTARAGQVVQVQSKGQQKLTLYKKINFLVLNLEVRLSHCVLNHNVQIKCENSNKHNYIWYLIASYPPLLAIRYQI